ncbi:MAG: hypothetical protein KJS45_03455, partial [Bacteroidetes bacterium]|nr:hypothetical protein [Bacteroidota bacterium]
MKQVLLIFLYMLTAYGNAYSQNCKYKVNEKDKFTGIYTKVTVSSKIISSHTTIGEIVMKSAEISIKKIDTSYFFTFDYTLSSYSNFKPYSIQTSTQLVFLLETDEIVTLHSADDIMGVKKVDALPPPT